MCASFSFFVFSSAGCHHLLTGARRKLLTHCSCQLSVRVNQDTGEWRRRNARVADFTSLFPPSPSPLSRIFISWNTMLMEDWEMRRTDCHTNASLKVCWWTNTCSPIQTYPPSDPIPPSTSYCIQPPTVLNQKEQSVAEELRELLKEAANNRPAIRPSSRTTNKMKVSIFSCCLHKTCCFFNLPPATPSSLLFLLPLTFSTGLSVSLPVSYLIH